MSNLPVHPTLVHPMTGQPVVALGYTAKGRVIWPVMGGSQPTGEAPQQQPQHQQQQPAPPPPGLPVPPAQPGFVPGPPPNSLTPPQPGAPGMPVPPALPGMGAGEHGYPDNTPVAAMTTEQQAAYWRHYARRNEDRLKQMGDYSQLKEQAEAYQKHLLESQTEQQKAIVEAESRGRKAAMAEAGGHMVEAYVRAAAAGRMSEEQVSTLLQGLDRTRFVNPATGQVDAQMVSGYIGMLAPAPMAMPGYPAPMPMPIPGAPGQQQPVTYPPQPGQWGAYPPQQPQPGAQPQQPDMGAQRQVPAYGQAQYPTPPARGIEAGKAIARQRFGKPAQQQ